MLGAATGPLLRSRLAHAAFSSSSPDAAVAAAAASNRHAFEYCASLVRTHDYASFLCAAALPPPARPAALALHAFNVETALVLGTVKEVPLALMRLRWWRDALRTALPPPSDDPSHSHPPPPGHPVPRALAASFALSPVGLQIRVLLERLALAREADAGLDGLPASMEALDSYARATGGSLLCALQLVVAPTVAHERGEPSRSGADSGAVGGVESGAVSDAARRAASSGVAAASAAGVAMGLARLLAGARSHLRSGRVYLPADVARREGVSAEALRRGRGGAPAAACFAVVAAAAEEQLALARSFRAQLSGEQRAALLPALPAGLFLDALRRVGYDAMHDSLAREGGVVAPLSLQARIGWAAFRGRY